MYTSMEGGPVVAGAPIEELMAMTVPELILWLTKNNVTLPSSKQTKKYYQNLALQTPNLIIGGTPPDQPHLIDESKSARPRKKKETKRKSTHTSVDSPSLITTRSKQAAALRAQKLSQVEDSLTNDIPLPDKEIEMDFPTEAGEVVAAPELESPALNTRPNNNIDESRNLSHKIAKPKPSRRSRRSTRFTSKVYCLLPVLILLVALIIGVLTQFYAFHVIIDPTSSRYQLSITSRIRQP